jgi:hypothetical protein
MSVAAALRLNWWSEAACQYADPDLFFPVSSTGRGGGGSQGQGHLRPLPGPRGVLDYAMEAGAPLLGIWGGTERRGPGAAAAQSPPRGSRPGTGPRGLTPGR